MRAVARFLRDRRGASAAEFALVLPLALLILFGIIDAGRYIWEVNQIEKAAQAGARYAVATAIIPGGLDEWDGYRCGGAVVPAGDPICKEALGLIRCASAGAGVACTCVETPCPALGEADSDAFARIIARMRIHAPGIAAKHVVISYSGSGIGYAADPATDEDGNPLSDIAPVVTVAIKSFPMRMLMLFGRQVTLPGARASLTLEDGDGASAS